MITIYRNEDLEFIDVFSGFLSGLGLNSDFEPHYSLLE